MKALAKNPADRFATMAAFDRALKEAIDPELTVVEPPPLPPAGRPTRQVKKRRWISPLGCVALSLTIMLICVGGPTTAIWFLIGRVKDVAKELADTQRQSVAEWTAINAMWQPPPENADENALFPQLISGDYRRSHTDNNVADTELGLSMSGRRALYIRPKGEEIEVRAYRRTEAEASAIQSTVRAFLKSVQDGTVSARVTANRQKVVYFDDNPGMRTVSFGFLDESNKNSEYGKIWYGGGWLFYFRTTTPLIIESFPSRYLLEVGKQATGPNSKRGSKKGKS
jgi:hypothetical protein